MAARREGVGGTAGRSGPPRRRERWRRIRGGLGGVLFAAGSWIGRPLPRRFVQACGHRLGGLAWRLARRDRGRTLEHLALAFPELAAERREELGRACFRHLGTSLFEALWLARRGEEAVRELVRWEGWEEVAPARQGGTPVLVLSAHCGNWELLAVALTVAGLPMSVVARTLDEGPLNRALVGLRARFGTETIERGSPGAPRRLLKALRSGGALGMLIDQDTRVDGVFVPFFGHPAFTPVGAAEIALRRGARVLPAFIERLEDGRHLARMSPPLDLPDDPVAATALMTRLIEEQIRRVPEQWVWMHRRWRRRP